MIKIYDREERKYRSRYIIAPYSLCYFHPVIDIYCCQIEINIRAEREVLSRVSRKFRAAILGAIHGGCINATAINIVRSRFRA